MARIRQVKPEFFLDDDLAAACCRDARLLFIGMWNLADREGRLEDRPGKIKAQIFPYDDDVTVPILISWIDQLAVGLWIVRYEVDGKRYLWVRTLKLHQHFHRDEQPSKLPEPPQDVRIHPASTVQPLLLHPTCTPTSTSGYQESGNGNLVSGAAHGGAARGAKKHRTSQKTGCPKTFDFNGNLKEWASKVAPNLDLEAETEKFLDYHRAKGSAFVDWDAAWKLWIRNGKKFAEERELSSSRVDNVGVNHHTGGPSCLECPHRDEAKNGYLPEVCEECAARQTGEGAEISQK